MKDKKRFQRWLALMIDIRNGRCSVAREMAEKYGVSDRTINKDIKEMTQAGVPIYWDREKRKYLFPENVFMPPVNLTLDDYFSLSFLLSSLNQKGELSPLIQKLHALNPARSRLPNGDLNSTVKIQTSPIDPKMVKWIYESIALRRKLRFNYLMPGREKPFKIYVDPHGICFVKRAWYMAAWYVPQESLRFYRINRMSDLEVLYEKPYEMQETFDMEAILSDAWNVMRGEDEHHIKIRFSKYVSHLIKEVDWHASQVITEEADGSILFEVDLSELNEIRYWILSFAQNAQVLEPASLRDMVAGDVEKMYQNYFK